MTIIVILSVFKKMNRGTPRFFSRLPEQFGGKVPFIVTDLINQLRELNAVETEGIFRKNGSAHDLTELSKQLDNGRIKDWSQFKNVHTLACCLKRYFRDMIPNNPLFPHNVYSQLVTIPQIPGTEAQAKNLKVIFETLPKPRQLTIAYLFKYILEVESQKDINKMNAQNLAIVFSPNIICTLDQDPVAALTNNTIQNKFVTTIINIGHLIFDDIDLDNSVLNDEDIPIIAAPPISKADIDKFVTLRDLRRRSYISYVPQDGFNDPRFVRPTREVVFDN